jgi:quercetin dioxygenase-like cupin family protein
MIEMRIAGGILAVAALVGVTACTSSSQAAPTIAPTTAVTSEAPAEVLTPLLEQALPNVPGKTFTSALVDFPPGARAVPHRHGEAFVYAYVLEGSVRSTLDDNPVTTYRAGENWVEQPGAHHVRTENTSTTDPAKLLVVFVSTTGDSVKVDDGHR